MFSKNIGYLRKKFGLSQDEMANKIGVSRQTISKWENGDVTPDSQNLIELAKFFKVKVHDLVMSDLTGNVITETGFPIPTQDKVEGQSIESAKIKVKQLSIVPFILGASILLALTILSVFLYDYFKGSIYDTNKEVVQDDYIESEPEEEEIASVGIDYQKKLSAGRYFTIVIDANSSLNGYGENTYRQLDVKSWVDIIEVSAGGFHTLGLKNDGTVLATGYNEYGQLNVEQWSQVEQISAGRYHSLGLREDGTVLCTGGEKKYAQCDVSSWRDIIQVSAGRYNSYGLVSDGTVVTTQDNGYGQANISSWKDIVQVSSGTYHVLGLKSDGTVICAGGQKGDGACNVNSWRDIVQVAGAGYHSIGLKNDGVVVAVGNNDYGQLNVSSWADVVAITGGRYHTVGMLENGDLVAVGSNEEGQISFISQ